MLKMKKEFEIENGKRKQEKDHRENDEKQEEKEFKMTYFPYTHGEEVESKRKQ